MPDPVLRYLRAALGPDVGPSDGELLARFVAARDEAAFELLVWRHAGAVRRACELVLRDRHLAEDAAQAAFLTLARKAGSVRRPDAVGGWLLRVARRVAVRAARRRRPESVDLTHAPAPASAVDGESAQAVRDAVTELPERYRLPVLLCFFEGLTHSEAAARLGWPVGTVAGRLARAKDRLGVMLARRGVTGAVGVLAAGADVNAVSHAWVRQTAGAAAAFAAGRAAVPGVSGSVLQLAKGTVWAMTAMKLKWAAGVVTACGVLATGGAWVAGQTELPGAPPGLPGSPKPGPMVLGAPPAAVAKPAEPRKKQEIGRYQIAAVNQNGWVNVIMCDTATGQLWVRHGAAGSKAGWEDFSPPFDAK